MNLKHVCLLALNLVGFPALAADLQIASFSSAGSLIIKNGYPQGVVTVMSAPALTGPWAALKNSFTVGLDVPVSFSPPSATTFYRALAVDLSGVDSWLFTFADIVDLGAFADRVGAFADGVSVYLANNLSVSTQDLLSEYGMVPDSDILASLVPDLNGLLEGPSIYDSDRFAGVTLSAATQTLLAENPQGSALIRLNRMLFDDAYPEEFAQKQDNGFPNLVQSYGVLTTIAGAGGTPISPNNKWLPEFEGGPATNALLSRPHIAMADQAGNVYIADKEAYAIRKVTLDGNIHTVAGNNMPGLGDTNPVIATSVSLNNPNGLWVFPDGKFYILDRDNGLIRKVDTNGIMTVVVNHGSPIPEGRGLWVSPDESILYYSAGTSVMRWDVTNGLARFATNFSVLGNLAVDLDGRLCATDWGANFVYRLAADGSTTVIAGNGNTSGGGDGALASETGLWQVRGIWFLPTGAYFLGTDTGSQVWYVDTSGYIHLFLNGNTFSHTGDGSWFYDPATPKVSKVRQITMDFESNLIVTENDSGYIRKVQFLRHQPPF
jgi:hypothetical protein